MKKDYTEFISEFLWDKNNQENRNKIAKKLSEVFGFEIKDESQPTMIDNGFISLHGFNPATRKVMVITITGYKVDVRTIDLFDFAELYRGDWEEMKKHLKVNYTYLDGGESS